MQFLNRTLLTVNISLTDLPEEYHPAIDELTGDMRIIASGLEEKFQGMGVLIALALSEIFNGQTLPWPLMWIRTRPWKPGTA